MTEMKTIRLAGKDIDVPRLPLRINMLAYPICRKLTNGGLIDRVIKADGAIDCSADEMAELAELAFLAATAADATLDRDAFDAWTISPPELFDAFFSIRYQTGGWVAAEPSEGQPEPGEAKAGKKPRR